MLGTSSEVLFLWRFKYRMFNEELESALCQREITQVRFAEMSGLTPAAISQLISGIRQPTMPTMIRICTALDLTPNDLLGFNPKTKITMQKEISDLKWKLKQVRRLVTR